jgi:pyruvyltransferase
MRVYWDRCADGHNFGDVLTAALLRAAGRTVEWAEPADADLIGAGSILEAVPAGWTGTVLGTGLMWSKRRSDLSSARVLALRGKLTEKRADGGGGVLLADLGLLAPYLLSSRYVRRKRWTYGTMRHFVDRRPPIGVSIDPLAEPEQVVGTAASCGRIVSSSLHGLILADALLIPSLWDPHPDVLGSGFKFKDYASSLDEPIEPYVWRYPDKAKIKAKQAALRVLVDSL